MANSFQNLLGVAAGYRERLFAKISEHYVAKLFPIQKICVYETETDTVSCIFETC